MGWRESFREMTPEQRRHLAIMADALEGERLPPNAFALEALRMDADPQDAYIQRRSWAELYATVSHDRSWQALLAIFRQVAPMDQPWTTNTPTLGVFQLILMAEKRGIDLDPIVDAVLMGEERLFLERLTIGR